MPTPKFTFHFYRVVGMEGARSTESVSNSTQADDMRGLVERNTSHFRPVNLAP